MTLFWMTSYMGDVSQMPVVLIYCFVMLFYKLGLSFLSGVGVFVLAFIVNFGLGLVS